jgi:uncharacterized protein
MTRFFEITLRTHDVDAARAFYASVLGGADFEVVRLHEQAVARGAPAHWLGLLDVDDVRAAVCAFVARGATALSPTWRNPAGLEGATLRDPGGALLGLARPPRAVEGEDSGVAWHVLHTADVARAKVDYAELFGWELKAPIELGALGVFHPFSWVPGGEVVGVMGDISARPGVHPQWLFHFPVAALEPAMQTVRAAGGRVIGPLALPSGERVAVCDDPQGAAFALLER